jgi:hypothetical protein
MRQNSVGFFDDEALKEKAEQDDRVASYVSDRLERMKVEGSTVGELEDEIETQTDGGSDYFHPRNGRARRPSSSSSSGSAVSPNS